MNTRFTSTSMIFFLIGACASSDGTYSPDCMAYAGSNVELSGGNFTWEKFTDAVVLDDDGKVVNQFPGYPKQGSYSIDGHTVSMTSQSGESMENMYLHKEGRKVYLLSNEQNQMRSTSGEIADCALTLGGHSTN